MRSYYEAGSELNVGPEPSVCIITTIITFIL